MSGASEPKDAKILQFKKKEVPGQEPESSITQFINDAHLIGPDTLCVAAFRTANNIYGIYGSGTSVAGVLRNMPVPKDFSPISVNQLPDELLEESNDRLVEGGARKSVLEALDAFGKATQPPVEVYSAQNVPKEFQPPPFDE